LAAIVAIIAYPKFKKIEKRGPAPEIAAAILSLDPNSAETLVSTVFNNWSDFDRPGRVGAFQNKFPASSQWSHFFLFRKDAPGTVFPSDDEIVLDHGKDNFIDHYVHIPAAQRAGDFYLYEPTGDYYWPSEYFYKGEPAPFRCAFLIHPEPSEALPAGLGAAKPSIGGAVATKLEIFEYQPEIWVGQYLGLTAHGIGPVMLRDIRLVEETTADRQSLLALLQSAANTASQRTN
jgi:hypothetical protein